MASVCTQCWLATGSDDSQHLLSTTPAHMQVMTQEAALAVAARTMEPVHRTPARLRRDPVPEPILHPLIRQKLAAALAAEQGSGSAARWRGAADGKLNHAS